MSEVPQSVTKYYETSYNIVVWVFSLNELTIRKTTHLRWIKSNNTALEIHVYGVFLVSFVLLLLLYSAG